MTIRELEIWQHSLDTNIFGICGDTAVIKLQRKLVHNQTNSFKHMMIMRILLFTYPICQTENCHDSIRKFQTNLNPKKSAFLSAGTRFGNMDFSIQSFF